MKNKFTALMLCISVTTSLIIAHPVNAQGFKVNINTTDTGTSAVISDELAEIIKQESVSSTTNKIPVSIEFDDNYNESLIDEKVYEVANITKEEILEIESALWSTQNEENSVASTTKSAEIISNVNQENLLLEYDRVTKVRTGAIMSHVQNATATFIQEAAIATTDIESTCTLIPMISLAWLTAEQIQKLKNNPSVTHIEYVDVEQRVESYVTNARTILGGNIAINNGYTGSNIRVGVIDSIHPILSEMGADSSNIILTNSGETGPHSTMVCGIIKKMAPDVTIYSSAVSLVKDLVSTADALISEQNVHVINMSCGKLSSTGSFNAYSRAIDELIYRTKCTICIAAGNPENEQQTIYNMYVNQFGLAPNAITVGAVTRTGTNPEASNAFATTTYSMYREMNSVVNKPDVCAPGNVAIYSYSAQGTSLSTPLVTGTIVQMMARNGGLINKPETLKAALMASASYNSGTSMSYLTGTKASNQEGAGVIDAGFCYQVASNGRRTHFDATESSSTFTYDVYCDYTTIPFRIACVWEVLSTSSATNITDFDMYIYKNGVEVAHSNAYAYTYDEAVPISNYEIIELSPDILSTYGAGYYQVEIRMIEPFYGSGTVRAGLAWEQR